MIKRLFVTKDKREYRALTQQEIELFWKNLKDEECRRELLKQAYEKAITPVEKEEFVAQFTGIKPTKI